LLQASEPHRSAAPDWGKVEQTISVPTRKLAGDEPLTLELFSIDQVSFDDRTLFTERREDRQIPESIRVG